MTQTSLGRRLRLLRAERELSLRQAAERAGVVKETISDIERGATRPHDVTLSKLAKAYGIPLAELLEEEEASLVPSGKAEAPEGALTGLDDALASALAKRVDAWVSEQEKTTHIFMPEEEWVRLVGDMSPDRWPAESKRLEVEKGELEEAIESFVNGELSDMVYRATSSNEAMLDHTRDIRLKLRSEMNRRLNRKLAALHNAALHLLDLKPEDTPGRVLQEEMAGVA